MNRRKYRTRTDAMWSLSKIAAATNSLIMPGCNLYFCEHIHAFLGNMRLVFKQ